MDTLQDLLERYAPQEPAEVIAIKRYIYEQFDAQSSVTTNKNGFVITVSSGSLANALRLRILDLQSAAKTDKRITFRIG